MTILGFWPLRVDPLRMENGWLDACDFLINCLNRDFQGQYFWNVLLINLFLVLEKFPLYSHSYFSWSLQEFGAPYLEW